MFLVKKTSWSICLLQTHSFLLHKMFNVELESCGFLVDYCDVFISYLDSHFDGTHSLQRIHWWASDLMLNFSKSVLMEKNLSTFWIDFGRGICLFIFYNISLSWNHIMYNGCFLFLQICAVLAAVTEVIRSQGGKETETEYFAALVN